MRIVFVGVNSLTIATARLLIGRGHDVVMVEADKDRIDQVNEELDCGFIHGDGTRPGILREANPAESEYLFCLTDNDQNNIIASLIGRSQGFEKVVTKITDVEYERICTELGLNNTIIPDRTIARTLADMVEGHNIFELSTMIKGELRFFLFLVGEAEAGKAVSEVELPDRTQVVCIYRGEDFVLPDGDTKLREGEQVLLVTHRKHLPELHERWGESELS